MLPTDTALRFPLLCRAWGESELPSVRIVNTPAEIREFLVAEWLGEEGDQLDDTMLQLNDPDEWQGDTPDKVSFEFEFGGVSLERVHASGATAPDYQALKDRQTKLTDVLKTLADKTDDLIVHLKNTGRLATCFNLPALTAARAAIAEPEPQATPRLTSSEAVPTP